MAKERVRRVKSNLATGWKELLEQFLWWKQAEGISDRTVEDYRYFISKFFQEYPLAIQDGNLKKYAFDFLRRPVKPAYFNLRLIYLRAFFEWCRKEGVIAENPLQGIKKRKAEGRIVDIDEETLKRLISLPNLRTYSGLRDYALILITLDTGIRPSEAFSLQITDINLRSLEINIRSEVAKTRTSRSLFISPIIMLP